jgi:hypothetical protein
LGQIRHKSLSTLCRLPVSFGNQSSIYPTPDQFPALHFSRLNGLNQLIRAPFVVESLFWFCIRDAAALPIHIACWRLNGKSNISRIRVSAVHPFLLHGRQKHKLGHRWIAAAAFILVYKATLSVHGRK